MKTDLTRISQLSTENPDMVFTSIGHLINAELLIRCHKEMDADKAVGIDDITKDIYEQNLEGNIRQLVERLKRKSYHPKPARRVEIPKENGKTRPLSIYCYEDKLVQSALKQVLEAVFEPHFYNEMTGFRQNRSCHMALKMLNVMIENRPTEYILDADIQGFFDHIDHNWAVKFIEYRIKDPNILRLVRVMLKAGIMKDYVFEVTEEGSGQGSVCSPIIANIYMHYVLLKWFKEEIQPNVSGYSGIVAYADDFVVCFEHKSEANMFYEKLKQRTEAFGLQIAEEKTRLIEFGKFWELNRDRNNAMSGDLGYVDTGKPMTFTFLGFTHYCSKSRNGRFRVKRKTSRKKFSKKAKELNGTIAEMRWWPLEDIFRKINQILTGYFNYYCITDNSPACNGFRTRVIKILFNWLNKRSQKRSYTWSGFNKLLKRYGIVKVPKPKSIYDLSGIVVE